jgi:hypothetical protein
VAIELSKSDPDSSLRYMNGVDPLEAFCSVVYFLGPSNLRLPDARGSRETAKGVTGLALEASPSRITEPAEALTGCTSMPVYRSDRAVNLDG